jgi:hypothetical protein
MLALVQSFALVRRRFPVAAAPRHICVILFVLAGCNQGPGTISPPDVDAASAADNAVELYDKNADGQLSKTEWSASPALAAVAASYDKSGDRTLSADEISLGIAAWEQSGVGARTVPFVVRWNGRPLAGAIVRLVPAPFLEGAVKGAAGETGASGAGHLSVAPDDRPPNAPDIPLMQPGLYHVEITHPSTRLPAKFNSQTTLGIEITRANPGPEGALWSLSP